LGAISGNQRDRVHLNPYQRGQIAGKASEGAKPADIAADLNLTRSIIYYIFQQDELRDNSISLPRIPRKKSYTDTEERLCVCYCRINPKDTYQQVIDACGLSYKKTTVKKILKKYSMANWRAKKRLELTEAHALKQLAWALAHRGWTGEE
jgi:hypothetical protein